MICWTPTSDAGTKKRWNCARLRQSGRDSAVTVCHFFGTFWFSARPKVDNKVKKGMQGLDKVGIIDKTTTGIQIRLWVNPPQKAGA